MNAVKELINKYRPKIVKPLTLFIFLVGILNVYFQLEITPISNDECLWINKKQGDSSIVVFDFVKFEGVTWNAGIRDGDRLIAINGKNIKNSTDIASSILNRLEEGEIAKYVVSRNDEVFEAPVKIKKLINYGNLTFAFLSIIWILVGYIVISSKPDGKAQIVFYRIGVLFGITSLIMFYIGNNSNNPITQIPFIIYVLDIAYVIGNNFLPFVIVHFFWIFPRDLRIVNYRYTLKLLYSIPLIMSLFLVAIRVLFVYSNMPTDFAQLLIRYQTSLTNLLFVIALIIGLISLFINYFKLENSKERNAIFVILVNYTLGVIAIIYSTTAVNFVVDTIFNSPEQLAPMILLILLPISFGYSIFKYSLMDVSEVIKKTIMYGAATLSIAAIYFLVVWLIGSTVTNALGAGYQGVIAGFIFITFALVFQSTKDRFQTYVNKKFYPEQFAFQQVVLNYGNEVSKIVGFDNVLEFSKKTLVDSLQISKFGIFLKCDDVNGYKFRNGIGFEKNDVVIKVDMSQIIKLILERNSLNKIPAIQREQFHSIFGDDERILLENDIYTILPMLINSKLMGLMLFGLKKSGLQFNEQETELLFSSASQTAISIENARLYEAEAEKLKLDRDLENARLIQESLLPMSIPFLDKLDISGKMIPAMHVGGDYFDVIKVSNDRIFVIVGDVSGKGLAASFYMSKLQTMIRIYCTSNVSPKDLMIEVNKRIYKSIERNWFITVSVALFDLKENKVSFCRAGHVPLLVIQSNNSIVEFQPKGIGIGIEKGDIFNSSIEQIDIPLKKDDVFILYSDGLIEAMNGENELFGIDRLKTVVKNSNIMSSFQIQKNLLDSIQSFRNGREINDDLTLVVTKVK